MKLPDYLRWMINEDFAGYTYCNMDNTGFRGIVKHSRGNDTLIPYYNESFGYQCLICIQHISVLKRSNRGKRVKLYAGKTFVFS